MSLIMLLSANSRLSYAELAEKLNLSVNAVHKRIQLLIETGVIRMFTAKVGLQSLLQLWFLFLALLNWALFKICPLS